MQKKEWGGLRPPCFRCLFLIFIDANFRFSSNCQSPPPVCYSYLIKIELAKFFPLLFMCFVIYDLSLLFFFFFLVLNDKYLFLFMVKWLMKLTRLISYGKESVRWFVDLPVWRFSMLSCMLILFLEHGLVKIKLIKLNQNLDLDLRNMTYSQHCQINVHAY